jgi:hypothetical protein
LPPLFEAFEAGPDDGRFGLGDPLSKEVEEEGEAEEPPPTALASWLPPSSEVAAVAAAEVAVAEATSGLA